MGLKSMVQGAFQGAREADPYTQSNLYATAARANLPAIFEPAYRGISEQLRPQRANARRYLRSNPAAGGSGLQARLNRRLLQSAYASLGGELGGASAGIARGANDILGDLIRRRAQSRYDRQAAKEANKTDPLGTIVGTGLSLL